MRRSLFSIVCHSIVMVGRTARNYAMLSMTVVLSFSILLCYLLITDSGLYNQYKVFLNCDQKIVMVTDLEESNTRIETLLKQAEKIGTDMSYYIKMDTISSIPSFWGEGRALIQHIHVIPSGVWGIYNNAAIWTKGLNRMEILWLDGRETSEVYLKKNEILLERGIYEYMKLDEMEEPVYQLRIPVYSEKGTEEAKWIDAKVVGLIETAEWEQDSKDEKATIRPDIYISQASLDGLGQLYGAQRDIIFSSDEPAALANAGLALGLNVTTMYGVKEIALREMKVHTETKAIIAMVLCVLLAINLYGSFSNALQSRKFEVGVKRAIGASKWAIIRQFLWEGMIVMGGNIMLSMMIVMDGALVYKYLYQMVKKEVWTIYLSGASAAMFGVVTVSLTIIFSLVFAIQTTQVEIVQYLKAE